MAFPLDIRTELNIGGSWTDISPDVYVREVKQIARGLRDQGSAADPSSLQLTLNNRSGKYSPRNAMSPLFGQIGRNTPIRVSVPGNGDSYLQLDGNAGNFVSTPDTAALDITGDIDVRAEVAPDWYGSSNQILIGKWDRVTLQLSWALQVSNGLIHFRYTIDGDSATGQRFFIADLPQLPERAAVRATLDIDNGAGGNTVTFYWADSLDGPWTQIGSPQVVTAGTTPMFAGTAPLQVGVHDPRDGIANARYPLNGRGYRFEVRNGIGGPVVASPDFRTLAEGTTSFADSAGRTWTLNGNAEIRDREDRFVGGVSSWPLRWSTDDADIWSPITAHGVMHRMGQGVKALDSTLRRRIPSGNPVAYWPMEEQQEATRAYSPIPGCQPASVSSVDWASWNTLPSSAPLPKLTGISSLAAPVPAFEPGQWQVEFVYTADSNVPLTDTEVIQLHSADGTVRRWRILMANGVARIRGYDAGNSIIVSRNIIVGADVFQGWVRFRFWARDDGAGNFTWRISWQDVGGDAGGFTAPPQAGTVGSLVNLSADWSTETEGWGIGHLSVLPDAPSTLYDGSDDAYLGETAWERMVRLANEEGFSVTRTPGRLPVAKVGFQRADSLLNVMESAADGDGGMLTEDMRRIGLHYRDRSSLYTQEPRFTLSYNAPGLGPDIEPVDDDSAVVNDVTVTRDGGSSARAVLDAGSLSVSDIGKYDAAYTVSVAEDDQTEPLAYWKLHLGTHDGARYPSIELLLHKPGAEWLIPLVHALREGDKIRLTDLPEWVSHDDVDLLVMGWSETLDMYRWEVTLNCAPAGPWDTAVVEHALFSMADTDGSVLGTGVTATDTTLNVQVTAGPQWTTDPAFLPYPIRVAGEVMHVTAATVAPADYFTSRVNVGGWGTSADGSVWTANGGTLGTDYAVNAGAGKHIHTSKGITRRTVTPAPAADVDLMAVWSWDKVPTGDTQFHALMARYADTNNQYFARVLLNTSGTMTLSLRKRVAGAESAIGSTFTLPGTYTAGAKYNLRFAVQGSTLSAKAWLDGTEEPVSFQLNGTDTALTAAGSIGALSFINTGSTLTTPVTLSFDSIAVQFQRFTVQRSINGVVKPQLAGTAVNVATPAITSL